MGTPAALCGRDPHIRCYECAVRSAEDHHLAGRRNAPVTVALPANVHRVMTDEQRDWPAETLRNPRRSPARRDAAWLRALLDTQRVTLDQLASLIRRLEAIDEALTSRFGECWPQELGLDDPDR